MKKILYITEQFPYPPESGGTIKTLNTLNTLAGKYQVHLVSFSPHTIPPTDRSYLREKFASSHLFVDLKINHHVKNRKRKLFKNYLRGIPYQIFQYQNQEAKRKISRLIKQISPDIIHIDHLNMAQYLPSFKQGIWIYEEHNLESFLLWSRFLQTKHLKTKLFLLIEAVLTIVYELKQIAKFDAIFSITDHDKKVITRFFPNKIIKTYLLPFPQNPVKQEKKSKNILFIGDLTWHPNYQGLQWFVNNVLPKIKASEPKVELHLVGSCDSSLDKLKKDPQIIFHDHQKKLKPYLEKASVFIMPFNIGGGLKIKALTALAAGIPIVSTPAGVRGLNLCQKKCCLLADSSQKFAEQVQLLLRNQSLRKDLTQKGFEYLNHHHQEKNNEKFLKDYAEIISTTT